MPIVGPDVSSNQGTFNFALAYAQGARTTYIKLGGDNIPRYVSGSYAGRVDQARAAGLRVGHYWITGGHDPVAAAQFFVRNLRNVQPGDYFVLDNEALDDGNMYGDGEAAQWIATVQSLVGGSKRRVFMYCSQWPLSQGTWAGTRATGCQALVAWYGRAPLSFGAVGAWPASQIGGHQFTSSANMGGWPATDLNVFKDNAFDFSGTLGTAKPIEEEEDVDGFYVKDIKSGKFYWFSPTRGKLRAISKAEWDLLRSVEASSTAGDTYDVKLPIVSVSPNWVAAALKL